MAMEKRFLVVCFVVGLLGLISAATGIGAEATRIKVSEVQVTSPPTCIFPRSPAMGLGLTAAVTLVIAQLILNIETGCMCCCRRDPRTSNKNRTLGLISFFVSWFAFVTAVLLFLTGAALNDEHDKESVYWESYYCYVVKPGVFAIGSVLSLISVVLGINYYLTLASAKNANDPQGNIAPNEGGIAMGQPQIPPHNIQDPVFVHEDTYIRRQFT